MTENPTQTVLCCLKEGVYWHIWMRCNLASSVPWFMLKSHYQELSSCYPFLGSTSPVLARFWDLTWLRGACQPPRDLNPGAKSKSLCPSIPGIIPEGHQDSNELGVLPTLPQPCDQGKYDLTEGASPAQPKKEPTQITLFKSERELIPNKNWGSCQKGKAVWEGKGQMLSIHAMRTLPGIGLNTWC